MILCRTSNFKENTINDDQYSLFAQKQVDHLFLSVESYLINLKTKAQKNISLKLKLKNKCSCKEPIQQDQYLRIRKGSIMSLLTKNHIINQQKNQISDIIQFETMEYQIEFEAQQQTNFFSFQQAGSIRKGDYCMILNHPTKIVDINVSKPGKHGSAKAVFIGVDIFTNKKYEQIFSTSENVMVPNVQKYELKVADINDDDFTALILPDYSLRQDLKLPVEEDLNQELRQVYQRYADQQSVYFTIMKSCGKQKIISARATKN